MVRRHDVGHPLWQPPAGGARLAALHPAHVRSTPIGTALQTSRDGGGGRRGTINHRLACPALPLPLLHCRCSTAAALTSNMPPVTCCHLARSQCRPDRRELLEKATYYEDLATETLRCVRSSAVAYALLSVIPWELCSAPKKGDGEPDKHVVPLWASSVLDEASTADGLRSFPCRHFIGHRHSQETPRSLLCGREAPADCDRQVPARNAKRAGYRSNWARTYLSASERRLAGVR